MNDTMYSMLNVKIKRTHPESQIPTKGREDSDAGWDLYARTGTTIADGEHALIPVGVAMDIPVGWVGVIKDRSGMAWKRQLEGSGGIIDASYRGEIHMILRNFSGETVDIEPGERVGQMLFLPVPQVDFEEVDELSETVRGDGGFGSSGYK